MKKFKIKYQLGNQILLTTVEAKDAISARYCFYMKHITAVDILEIEEVKDES